MAIGRGKNLKPINTPSHSPNDGQASPCLNSIPLKHQSSSLVPSYALFFLITVFVLVLVAPQSIDFDLSCSCKPGYMLFFERFDTVLMKSTKIHSPLQTLTQNLTPPSLQVKLPLKTPSFPLYPNSINKHVLRFDSGTVVMEIETKHQNLIIYIIQAFIWFFSF